MTDHKRASAPHLPATPAEPPEGRGKPKDNSARELLERWRIVPSVDRAAFGRDLDRIVRPE